MVVGGVPCHHRLFLHLHLLVIVVVVVVGPLVRLPWAAAAEVVGDRRIVTSRSRTEQPLFRRRRLWPAAQVERYNNNKYNKYDNENNRIIPPPSTPTPLYTLSLSFQDISDSNSNASTSNHAMEDDAARFPFFIECTNTTAKQGTTGSQDNDHDNNKNSNDDRQRNRRRCPRHVRSLLRKAQHRFYAALRKQIQRLSQAGQPSRHSSPVHPPHPQPFFVKPLQGIRISLTSPPDNAGTLYHGVDESYTLTVPHRATTSNTTTTTTTAPTSTTTAEHNVAPLSSVYVSLVAPTAFGAMHALQSLLQLLDLIQIAPNPPDNDETNDDQDEHGPSSSSSWVYAIRDAPLIVQDFPAYPYRGLMVDTSRHYLPLSLIRHTLHALELHKLNALHWHMTDSQSWPYQSSHYPELSNHNGGGAYCPTCIYNASDILQIVNEAAERGIHVVLELDLPGHCQSIGASHPELLTSCGFRGPSEPLDVTRDDSWALVETLYSELDQLVKPYTWIHAGGDEVNLDCWKKSPSVQTWMRHRNMTSEKQLQQYFEARLLHHMTHTLHRTPIVWQEAFDAGGGLDLPPTTVVDVWKEWDTKTRETATLQGHPVLFSACWYLDHLNEDWRSFYKCDPRDFNATGGTSQLLRVMGGHASMWGERVDETNFDPRVWPRASATAERLWIGSPSTKAGMEAAATAEDRLDKFRCLLLRRGIQASPIRPGSCDESPSLWTVIGDEDGVLFTTEGVLTS